MSVREDQAIRPNGQPGIYGVITMGAGVCVLPVDAEHNVYLVKQYRYGVEHESYEAIAGGTEGKDPTETARRELHEETGNDLLHSHSYRVIDALGRTKHHRYR